MHTQQRLRRLTALRSRCARRSLAAASRQHGFTIKFTKCPFLLKSGDELRYTKCRNIEPFARQRVEVVQAVGIFLESNVAAISTYEHIGIHKDVVGVETLFCHGSMCIKIVITGANIRNLFGITSGLCIKSDERRAKVLFFAIKKPRSAET